MSIPPAFTLPPLLDTICSVLPAGLEIYLVGGAVRDLLLGRETHDLDFALQGDGIRVARTVADALGADVYPLDPARATGRVLLTTPDGKRHVLDFAALRGPDLEADLRGRDFTLNAIALALSDRLLRDPLGGVADLRAGCLRQCSATTFRDDPLRILRGIRLAAAFNFSVQPETRLAMKQAGELLGQVSAERQRDELFRILEGPKPAACLRALDLLGVLERLFPDLGGMKGLAQPAPHVQDAWSHSLSAISHLETLLAALSPDYDPGSAEDLWLGSLVLRLGRYRQKLATHLTDPLTSNRSRRGLLFLAVLYHDAATSLTSKPGTSGRQPFRDHDRQGAQQVQDLAHRMALSNDEASVLARIIHHHQLIPAMVREQHKKDRPPSRRAVYRFFRQAGDCGVDLTLLALANLRATHEQALPQDEWSAYLGVCRLLLEAWWENRAEQIDPPALLRGEDVMGAFELQPGPRIGKLLELVREAQASGVVHSREQALQFLRRRLH